MRSRATSVPDARPCKWIVFPVLEWGYQIDVHTINGKSVVPLTCQTVRTGPMLTGTRAIKDNQTIGI